MVDGTLVNLSRLQFALTAMYHFLFVPLTLGLSFMMAIMESVYVLTGKKIYQHMTKFWGKLFAINFAMGVATGITLEFQFGMNWAYYSHYVGDVFGLPLALEGLIAFFLESTLIGLVFFGWERLTKVQHLTVTWLVALGSNLSGLWVLIANAWMQHPVGAEFNYELMRMELTSIKEVFFNPVAQVKFVHTMASGYVTGAMFVLGISSYYLLKGRDLAFARRSFAVASGFGLAAILSVLVLGDESGYNLGEVQKVKLAAIEGEWQTEAAPAAFTLFGIPNQAMERTDYALRIPYALGLIATRSFDKPVIGLKELKMQNEARIRKGITAYGYLQRLRAGENNQALKYAFNNSKAFLGYGLLVKRYTDQVVDASEDQIKAAATDTIPHIAPLFWSFRVMVGCGIIMLFIFVMAFYYNAKRNVEEQRWLLKLALYSMPLPWIAIEAGWIVAECGRQPWAIAEILPTFLGTSTNTVAQVFTSLIGLALLYTALLVVELWLMFKYARRGPSSLNLGLYHFETHSSGSLPKL